MARSLPAKDLENPDQTIRSQLEGLGTKATVVEPWTGPDKPVVVTLEGSKFSKEPLGQMLYIHLYPGGNGVLLTCTTKEDRLASKRDTFQAIVDKAKFDLADCPGLGGLPEVFPTPEATLRPI